MFLVIFLNSFFLNLKGYALLDLTLDSFGVEGIFSEGHCISSRPSVTCNQLFVPPPCTLLTCVFYLRCHCLSSLVIMQ